jgi:hypothetical protein
LQCNGSFSVTTLNKREGNIRKELQELSASTDNTNENEEKTAHPQPTKRQRKKPSPRDQDFLWTI